MINIFNRISQILPFLLRNIVSKQFRTYKKILKHISTHPDIWPISQGEYVSWWHQRENSTFSIRISDDICNFDSSLENAVIEMFPDTFIDSKEIKLEKTNFSGDLFITIDNALEKRQLLIEILRREGILNYKLASKGTFFLSADNVGDRLERINTYFLEYGRFPEDEIISIRQTIIDILSSKNLPLFRIWYHPRLVNGTIVKSVFSPRFDVDRAITNLKRIRILEKKFNVSSTLYVRLFCPFYSDKAIRRLAGELWCSEIALHGEFVTHASMFGDQYKTAKEEKKHLERLIKHPISGVAMHGGELSNNVNPETRDIIRSAGFQYYSVSLGGDYYFPIKRDIKEINGELYCVPFVFGDFRVFPFKANKKIVNGRAERSYDLISTLSQLKNPSFWKYNSRLYDSVIKKMDDVYSRNGVFVLVMHPIYFGFLSYLFNPANWPKLFNFFFNYFFRRFK